MTVIVIGAVERNGRTVSNRPLHGSEKSKHACATRHPLEVITFYSWLEFPSWGAGIVSFVPLMTQQNISWPLVPSSCSLLLNKTFTHTQIARLA